MFIQLSIQTFIQIYQNHDGHVAPNSLKREFKKPDDGHQLWDVLVNPLLIVRSQLLWPLLSAT